MITARKLRRQKERAAVKAERNAGREPADFETWLAGKTGKGKRDQN